MIREFFQPHPLTEFEDYDRYWRLNKHERGTGLSNFKTAKPYLAGSSSIIDVGCGTGEFLQVVREHYPAMQVRGVDIAKEAVALTRAKGFRADTLNLETQALRAHADTVTCFCVLEHVHNAERFFASVQRMAGKRLIVSIPNPAFLLYRVRYLLGSFPVMSCLYHIKEHIRFWTPRDFRYWLRTLFPQWRIVAIKAAATDPWQARAWPKMMANTLYYVLERVPEQKPTHP